jgi:hypothetical protein
MRVLEFSQKAGRVMSHVLGCDPSDWIVIRVSIYGTQYRTECRLFI